MFGFVQWESLPALLLEFLFALAVFALIMWVVLRDKKKSEQTLASAADTPPAAPPAMEDSPREKAEGRSNGPDAAEKRTA